MGHSPFISVLLARGVILAAIAFAFGCDANLNVHTSELATPPDEPVEEGDGPKLESAPKYRSSSCVDPDLTQVPSDMALTLCNGSTAFGSLDLNDLKPENLLAGTQIGDVTGIVPASPLPCASDGLVGCVATLNYPAIDASDLLPTDIRDGVMIAGVMGTYADPTPLCSANGEVGCIAHATYQAADLGNLVSGNIKNGATVAGTLGTYPSLASPLQGATADDDLTSLAAATPAGNYEFFDSAGTRYTGTIVDAATITPSHDNQTFAAGVYRQFTVAGDANLISGNVKASTTIFGVTGNVTPVPGTCSTNAQVGCVADATYQAADLTNLTAGNIKAGAVVAGVTGQFPSSTYPLNGASPTEDLPAFASAAGGTNYEWFQSDGTRLSGTIEADQTLTPAVTTQTANTGLYRSVTVAGDSDLVAGNIKDAVTIFNIAGTMVPTPADCASNGEIGCLATTTYKAADLTNLASGNIKNGVTLAGTAGTYPSLATPLQGATAASDLTSLDATTPAGSYEFFDSTGQHIAGTIVDAGTIAPGSSAQSFSGGLYRQFTVAGDAGLLAGNIKTAVTIFGVTGTVDPSPADCSANTEVGCVATATFKAADLSNLAVGNVKAGVVLAGVTGAYPSASHPLSGATGTDDLPAFSATASGASYEWFQADGTRLDGTIQAAATVTPNASSQTVNSGLYRSVTVLGDSNLVANNVKDGVTLFGVSGTVVPNALPCASDGEIACITTASYKAVDMANVTGGNIANGVVIAGVTGTLNGIPADCAANGEVGCVSTTTYKAANLTNLVSGNVKNGVTLAGTAGTYPSLASPLAGATGTNDLTSLDAATPAGAYEFFDSAGTRYTGSISDAATVTPTTTNQTFNTSLYRGFTVAGDADLTAANIKTGTNLFGVAGSLVASPANCTADNQTGCVATSVYKAADTGAYAATDLKSGKTVGGIAGSVPNCATDGAGACVVNGTTIKAARLSNFTAADVKTGVTIAAVAGSMTLESHTNCAADGATGCVAVPSYLAADAANVAAGNIKSGITIAGVAGQYPSATYPLPGAVGGTADLQNTTFNAQMRSASAFEYWNAAGARQTGAGEANITAANIVNGQSIFGMAGSAVVETHAACATDGGTSCVPDGASYKAARLSNFTAADVRSGVTIAGVNGSATMESHSDCASDGQTGCVATASFLAANATNVTAGNIKSGVTIGAVAGQYPSASYPLNGAGATADLTSTNFNTQVKTAANFEYWDSAGTRSQNTGDANIVAGKILTGNSIFGTAGNVVAETHSACASDGASGCYTDASYKAARLSNFTAADVKSGVTIAAVAGSATLESHTNCASDGAGNCAVNGTTYKAAAVANLLASNIRSGVTIGGVAGQYPSATYPLPGAVGGTPDLTLATFDSQIKSATTFEWWDANGTRYTGAGDADIQATNIAKDVSIFGTEGTALAVPMCGGAGDSCYEDSAAIAAGTAITPSGKNLVYVSASGTSFNVWKDFGSSKILRANGMDEWAMKLNLNGKGQMAAGNEFTSYSSLVGRKCPPNVYVDDSNKFTTTNCLYYTQEASTQGLNAAGTSQSTSGSIGMSTWPNNRWYVGNIQTCATKGMRLPALFETTAVKGAQVMPTGDGNPTFATTSGVPSISGTNTWSATSLQTSSQAYWTWNGTSLSWEQFSTSQGVRCVLP